MNSYDDDALCTPSQQLIGTSLFVNYEVDVSIIPNPTKGLFDVSGKLEQESDLDIVVYNTLGQVVWQKSFESKIFNESIDITTVPDGLYILNVIQNDELIFTEKIIKAQE